MNWTEPLFQIALLLSLGKMLALGYAGKDERKCSYSHVDKMLKIKCFDMNLKEVPQYLKKSVEVLDLSYNRIRKLKRSSFHMYKNIKFLLLYENMIQSVEPGTFEHLTSLQEIDLSNNGLKTIPLEIFHLPSLRNLYVDTNELTDLERDLEALDRPIRAPLEYLNVADCSLQNIPDLGILPRLWQINASSNPMLDLSMDRFANMCNLRTIALQGSSISDCSCQQLNGYLRLAEINFKYAPVCGGELIDAKTCPMVYNETLENPMYRMCKTSVSRAKTQSMWLFVAGCLGGVVVVLLLVWCCIHRRRKQRRAKKLKKAMGRKNRVISPINAINNNSSDAEEKRGKDNILLRCDSACA